MIVTLAPTAPAATRQALIDAVLAAGQELRLAEDGHEASVGRADEPDGVAERHRAGALEGAACVRREVIHGP